MVKINVLVGFKKINDVKALVVTKTVSITLILFYVQGIEWSEKFEGVKKMNETVLVFQHIMCLLEYLDSIHLAPVSYGDKNIFLEKNIIFVLLFFIIHILLVSERSVVLILYTNLTMILC